MIVITVLGTFSAASCIAAEFKRAKMKDLKLDGRFCYLPGNHAFGFGIAALVCLCIAQIIGNLVVCRNWISFGIGVTLLGSATSMSRRQPYGNGWLNGECYIVKDGVFFGSAVLVLLTIGLMLGSAVTSKTRKTQVDQEFTVHEQLDPKF
ncbi:hypothetical protein TIFTF001_016798 [Ficus carica]|uniref:Transmembrane protein n=1 Tax=Ficus carica TaxID=3494 RepID=A0AA88A110_FICCA|nr:hypothetical protein TIFTF001_016798 [Ficus carica]